MLYMYVYVCLFLLITFDLSTLQTKTWDICFKKKCNSKDIQYKFALFTIHFNYIFGFGVYIHILSYTRINGMIRHCVKINMQ